MTATIPHTLAETAWVISQLSGVTCESGGTKMKAPRTGCRKDANLLMGTWWVEVEVDWNNEHCSVW